MRKLGCSPCLIAGMLPFFLSLEKIIWYICNDEGVICANWDATPGSRDAALLFLFLKREMIKMIETAKYSVSKAERVALAKFWDEKMRKEHSDCIEDCIKNTKIVLPEDVEKLNAIVEKPKIYLTDEDTVSAILENNNKEGILGALNFASFTRPGGGFLNGARAQEECLCAESFLYDVLSAFYKSYYLENSKTPNRGLYADKALYSKDIHFYRGEKEAICDVITCSAPNRKRGLEFGNVTSQENISMLTSRIRFIMETVKTNKIDTLILGAFGCGVFGQNPETVASIFLDLIPYSGVKTVVFAIPDCISENYKGFAKAIEKYQQK